MPSGNFLIPIFIPLLSALDTINPLGYIFHMRWDLWIIPAVAILHISEEFILPGGFLRFIRQNVPRLSEHITVSWVVLVNSLFVALCIAGVLLWEYLPPFTVSVAGLLFINAILHITASIKKHSYSPGLFTSVVLYIPTSVYVYYLYHQRGHLTVLAIIVSIVLAMIYQATPLGLILLVKYVTPKRRGRNDNNRKDP